MCGSKTSLIVSLVGNLRGFAAIAGRRSMPTAPMKKAHIACTVGRTIMMKARMLVLLSLALGTASVALAQEPVQLKFSRVVDLTLPIESNMAPIPGFKAYAENPSRVNVISSITETQKEALRAEGMTLSGNHEVNNRAMITVLSILVHNGTHIDAPRHMVEKGTPIDQMPVSQFVKEGVLINLPGKGPNSVVTVKDVAESGVEIRPNTIVMINTGWTDRMWGKPGFWEQMPYLERGVAEYVANKGAAGLAIDVFPEKPLWRGVKLDPGEVWIANHLALMQKNLPLIQFVTNLSQIGNNRFTVVAIPLAIKGGDASPVRVVALVE
jgi:kynurenine formamidase